ncbi:LysR family transcriptional regulator [Fodinisporobacter ferrooxydans]|uniref:LysR family transcriptional regulator n=1 Tax=Fodinisporobacter ferrooxydans TaxID=2901836 RepID=A0ABY4CNX3_9BACL|nr:LysR family transcriptional regulator [Alicyclobacillaceae bacterium MYW30-H2]
MDVAALQTFILAAQYQSLNKAAKQLHISQPAVSIRIQTLEAECGYKLFEKVGRSLRLTPAGKQFYPYVARCLGTLSDGLRGLDCLNRQPMKQWNDSAISIAADEISIYRLSACLNRLNRMQDNGSSRVERIVYHLLLPHIQAKLVADSIQLAFISQEFHHPSLRTFYLCDEPFACVVHRQHQWRVGASDFPFFLPIDIPFLSTLPMHKELETLHSSFLRNIVYSNSFYMIRQSVISGAGFGIVPKWMVDKEQDMEDVVSIELPGIQMPNCQLYCVFSLAIPIQVQKWLISCFME